MTPDRFVRESFYAIYKPKRAPTSGYEDNMADVQRGK